MNTYSKVLTEEELATLSSRERREYQKQLRSMYNQEAVKNVSEQDEQVEIPHPTPPQASTPMEEKKKKSNAGRKPIADSEKKQQLMITLEAESKRMLESVDSKNYKKLLSRYIDKNIDTIVNAMKQL